MSIFLNNLDDFIAPSQACVNPVVSEKLRNTSSSSADSVTSSTRRPHGTTVSLSLDTSTMSLEDTEMLTSSMTRGLVHPSARSKSDLIKLRSSDTDSSVDVASVSLNDCLACSGCVTSSEAVLIQEQGHEKLRHVLDAAAAAAEQSIGQEGARSDSEEGKPPSIFVASISPQACASFAYAISDERRVCTATEAFQRMATFLKSLGFRYVFDTASGADVALLEMNAEFLERHACGRAGDQGWVLPPVSVAVDDQHANVNGVDMKYLGVPEPQPLPLLTSSCPGWVCFAEKSHPAALRFISSVKSPQQIIGSILKGPIAKNVLKCSPSDIYHVSIEPCFDKKLEASRLDFKSAYDGSREVDLVLASNEVWNLFPLYTSAAHVAITPSLWDYAPDTLRGTDMVERMFRESSRDGRKLVQAGEGVSGPMGSGGYLDYVARQAASSILGVPTQSLLLTRPLEYRIGRNPDMLEATITGPTGQSLKFARAYGFRNIQSIVTKMRRGKLDADFVEIMACPSGCINGGGQLKINANTSRIEEVGGVMTVDKLRADKVRTRVVDELYHNRQSHAGKDGESPTFVPESNPGQSLLAMYLYQEQAELRTETKMDDSSFPAIPGLGMQPYSQAARALLHTRYHHIPKLQDVAPLAAKW